jgi:hypothetical protein
MFKVNADRMVVDLLTGSLASQGGMLKTLMTRSGYGRNQWHKLAQQKVARLNSSPTSLSDIFAGRRGLPQRDIIPLISVLKLSESDREHYICEFLKGTIDESLNSFIAPTRRTKRYDVMKERIQELQFMIKELELCQFYEHNVEHFLELEEVKNKYKAQTNSEKKPNSSPILHPKPVREDYNDIDDYFIAFDDWAEHCYESSFPEPDFDDEDHIIEYIHTLSDNSQERSSELYSQELKRWAKAIVELDNNQNRQLIEYTSICLPSDFRETLCSFLSHDLSSGMTEDPLKTWEWVRKRVDIRPQKYIYLSLFVSWMREHPESFNILNDFYAEQYDLVEYDVTRPPEVSHPFSQYLSNIRRNLHKKCPNLYSLLRPSTRTIVINDKQTEKSIFYEYLSKNSKFAALDFNELIESIYPSALSSKDILYNLKLSIAVFFKTVVA